MELLLIIIPIVVWIYIWLTHQNNKEQTHNAHSTNEMNDKSFYESNHKDDKPFADDKFVNTISKDTSSIKNSCNTSYSKEQISDNFIFESESLISSHNYESEEWIQKRNEILKRDNYTCQCCHCFNPSLGDVIINKQDYIELHSYNKYSGTYHIDNSEYSIGIDISLGYGKKIVMPTLHVHHKCYIKGHKLWEYDDKYLITLCKKCHQTIHSMPEIKIPIFQEMNDGRMEQISTCSVKPIPKQIINPEQIETFTPWSVVEECNGYYKEVEMITPSYSGLFVKTFSQCPNANFNEIVSKIAEDFLQDYLGYYPKNST